MTAPLRVIPTEDRAWLVAALGDALAGGPPVMPVPTASLGKHSAESAALEELKATTLPEDTALVVRTSGSTGVPKCVALSASALRSSAIATHSEFGGPGQWLVALPTHLISGVQMLVRSEVSGLDPVFYDGGFDPERFLERSTSLAFERRYVSLVPMQLSRLIDLAEQNSDAADALRVFDAVLVGGQAVGLPLRRRAHELGIALRRSYGMTETAGGCVYDGVEIGDTRVRIRDGEVQLGGSSLALGYVDDPELTASRFFEDRGTRWYRTGDTGDLLGGMLRVSGRRDRVIISGGSNVSLDEVERVAREVSGWGTAIAIGTPHEEWGERVALIVETQEDAASFDTVKDVIRDQLGPAAAPIWATELDELPRLEGGKPDLRAVDEWVGRLRASFRDSGRRGADATPVSEPRESVETAASAATAQRKEEDK